MTIEDGKYEISTETETSPGTINVEVKTQMDTSEIANGLEEIAEAYYKAAEHLRDES